MKNIKLSQNYKKKRKKQPNPITKRCFHHMVNIGGQLQGKDTKSISQKVLPWKPCWILFRCFPVVSKLLSGTGEEGQSLEVSKE